MLWKKQFWTLLEGPKALDAVIVNGCHTEPCADFSSDFMTMNRTEPTLVRVGFSGYWIMDEDEPKCSRLFGLVPDEVGGGGAQYASRVCSSMPGRNADKQA